MFIANIVFIINHNKQTNVLGFVSLVCIYFMKESMMRKHSERDFPRWLIKTAATTNDVLPIYTHL